MNFTVRAQNGNEPISGAVISINAYYPGNPSAKVGAINPSVRYTDGGGLSNFVAGLDGGFHPPVAVDVTVHAAGYYPWCTADHPIILAGDDVEVVATLRPFVG